MDNLKRAVGDASSYISRAVADAHLGDEASVIYSRAKQFTEEKLGKAERTENEPHFEHLANATDKTKSCTEKIVTNTQAVLVPNPAARLESFMFDTIPVDRIGVRNTRQTNHEYLAHDMLEAGNEVGPNTPYGSALIRVGQTEQRLGELEREFIRRGHDALILPLSNFLENEMRNITRERKILENKRLDLDACKNKVRKARAMGVNQATRDGSGDPRLLIDQAESELRVAQSEYDRQVEITRLLMEGLNSIQTNHKKHLEEFVEAQADFYAQCHQAMMALQKEMQGSTSMVAGETASPILRSSDNKPALTDVNLTSPPST